MRRTWLAVAASLLVGAPIDVPPKPPAVEHAGARDGQGQGVEQCQGHAAARAKHRAICGHHGLGVTLP